jgi:hypothetical protein
LSLTETWTQSDDDVSGYLDSHEHYCVHGKDDIHVDVTPVEYAFLLRKPYYEA